MAFTDIAYLIGFSVHGSVKQCLVLKKAEQSNILMD